MKAFRETVNTPETPNFKKSRSRKYYGCTQEDTGNSDMSVDFDNSEMTFGQKLTSQLQTEILQNGDTNLELNFQLKQVDQNMDIGNCSTQSSSLECSLNSVKEDFASTCAALNSFSAKLAAPVKVPNRKYYKSRLKDFNRSEFSGKAFLAKLDKCAEDSQPKSLIPEKDDGMSLEAHLQNLAKRASANNKNVQNRENFAEDLQMKIVPKSCFNKGLQIVLQTKRRYYQKTRDYARKSSTHIVISMPSSIKNKADLVRNNDVFKLNRGGDQTCLEFFQKFSQEFVEKGVNLMVKVNDEPVFPAKATLDYLCSVYEGNEARVSAV